MFFLLASHFLGVGVFFFVDLLNWNFDLYHLAWGRGKMFDEQLAFFLCLFLKVAGLEKMGGEEVMCI